jgi:hypothetical protein
MKRCAHCRGRFGLIRYTAYRAFGSIIQFCCKKCERGYFDERRKESQSSRYRDSGEANFPPHGTIVRVPPSCAPSGAGDKIPPNAIEP